MSSAIFDPAAVSADAPFSISAVPKQWGNAWKPPSRYPQSLADRVQDIPSHITTVGVDPSRPINRRPGLSAACGR
jgi:hypothetical protein